MRRTPTVAVVFLALAFLAPPPSGAAQPTGTLTLAGDGWLALRVNPSGGTVTVSENQTNPTYSTTTIVFGYFPNGTLAWGIGIIFSTEGATEYHFGAKVPVGIALAVGTPPPHCGPCNASWSLTVNGTQDWIVGGWTVANATASAFRWSTSGLATVGSHTSGTAFARHTRDFSGPGFAEADVGGVDGQTAAGLHTKFLAQNSFVGLFIPYAGTWMMSADTPYGTQSCPCWLWQTPEPGAYTFHLAGAGYGPVTLTGADLTLPS
jgi:hypothetical protein